MSAAEDALAAALDALGLEYEREYRFDRVRRWRADFMLRASQPVPDATAADLLVEVEGRGRHQTYVGYRLDCEKYNAATRAGWRVLRYPAGDAKPSRTRKQWPRGVQDWADEIYEAVHE